MPILLAEDDTRLAEPLREILAREHQAVTGCAEGSRRSPMRLQEGNPVDDLLLLAHQEDPAARTPGQVDRSALVGTRAPLLQCLLCNLLDDAVCQTPEGGRIDLTARRQGTLVRVRVRVRVRVTVAVAMAVAAEDSGVGLEEGQIPQVLERFRRGSTDRRDGGSGLGRAIAARFCAAHAGRIHVTSRPGAGSRFVVQLPAAGRGKDHGEQG